MKIILSILFGAALAVNAFATGSEGFNPPQSGTINPATGIFNVTNTFAFPFQTTPLLVVYSAATNGTPITNNFVTTTNFSISYPVNGSTNASFSWQAYVGGTRMESGTQTVLANVATNITFPFAYAVPPVVVISGGVTNLPSAVVAVTTTNFTLNSNATSTNQWISVGTVYNPPSENVGINPPSNKVIY
jgi:hypothetical protein